MNPKNIDHLTAVLPLFATPATSIQIAQRTGRTTLSVQRTIRRMRDHGMILPAGWGEHTGRGSIPIAWIACKAPA